MSHTAAITMNTEKKIIHQHTFGTLVTAAAIILGITAVVIAGFAGGEAWAMLTFFFGMFIVMGISINATSRSHYHLLNPVRIDKLLEYARDTNAVEIMVMPDSSPVFVSADGSRNHGGSQVVQERIYGVMTQTRINMFHHADKFDVLALAPTGKDTKPLATGNRDGAYSVYVAEGATGIRIKLN